MEIYLTEPVRQPDMDKVGDAARVPAGWLASRCIWITGERRRGGGSEATLPGGFRALALRSRTTPPPLGLTQPTISHHLKILVEAGIFTRDKRGVWATTPWSPRL